MFKRLCVGLAAITISSSAWAGIPVDETVTCPVGEEEFTITNTLSCSTQGRTMSWRQETTCDFVTRLPVCPSNGLPLYRVFTSDQITDLAAFMDTPNYEAVRTLPPWQRAYGVAVHLGEAGTQASFQLLLSAMWHETGPFFDSLVAMNQLLLEAEAEMERAPEQARPFLNAILAYALAYAGRIAESEEKLERVRQAPGVPRFLLQYVSAIEACHADMAAPECRPSAPFDP